MAGCVHVLKIWLNIFYILRNWWGYYVGLGSDFDGIDQNLELADASMMPQLAAALQEAGFSENEIEKVFYKNVLRVYSQIL